MQRTVSRRVAAGGSAQASVGRPFLGQFAGATQRAPVAPKGRTLPTRRCTHRLHPREGGTPIGVRDQPDGKYFRAGAVGIWTECGAGDGIVERRRLYAGPFADQELSADRLYSSAAPSGEPADARVYFVVACDCEGCIDADRK